MMTSMGISGNTMDDQQNGNESKNFEEAILATKFGLFNIILLASCMIWFTASLIETTTSGVILPIAQCDLDLDPNRKGWLTSITFFGMIFGATIWGIIGDIYGRKIIISGGVFLLGIFNIVYGFSTSYYMLVTLKFFGGVIASGPVAASIWFTANTMRLWMPQVFALLSDSDSNDGICEHIVQPEISKLDFTNHTDDNVCQVLSDKSIYVNSIVVQAVGVLGVFLAVSLVTTVGNKTILIVTSMVASVATVAIYFAKNSVTIVILYSLSVGIAFSGQASFNSIVPNLVPTAFRFTVISVSVTLGRLGSMLGNLIFPNLMQLGCWQPFITIGLAFFIPAVLCLFLPRTTKQPLS
uniref:Major facilitator superfamily (MFS) profile domain-containing protein n=1 Tax=Phlebotomus papatasi TaxID=29031 RepID=A0A1B0CYW7_PHLPP